MAKLYLSKQFILTYICIYYFITYFRDISHKKKNHFYIYNSTMNSLNHPPISNSSENVSLHEYFGQAADLPRHIQCTCNSSLNVKVT